MICAVGFSMNKKCILMNRLTGYCSQLGLDVIPKIVWTKKELLGMGIPGKGLASKTTLGRCCRKDKVIYVAYSKHGDLRHLDDTLRHELIHFRFPFLQHGKKFDRLIKELKKGQIWDKFTTADFEKLEIEKAKQNKKRFLKNLMTWMQSGNGHGIVNGIKIDNFHTYLKGVEK